MKKTVALYDTTLRDGTQGLGVSFSSLDKLRVAEKLDEFGMDYIEGGWPGSNPKDVEFFRIARGREWRHARIAAFGSTCRKEIPAESDPQLQLLLEAGTPAVTVFGKSWDLHVTEILSTTLDENCRMIEETAAFFKKHGREFIYDAEHFFDGFKANADYALRTLAAARAGGADIVVLCDTNGGTMPHEVAEITVRVREALGCPVGIHTHDDCGLGVANALASVRAGATQVQGTMNGYGERTGNCNLTSVIPNLQLKLGHSVAPDLSRLTSLSHFVDELANNLPNPRAPFVGATAFAHKGGMHVNAVQKLARSYEHIEPAAVGNRQNILVSELSGGSNILMKAAELGVPLEKNDVRVRQILERVKNLENDGYEFEASEASFELLVRDVLQLRQPYFELEEYSCTVLRDRVFGYQSCEATVKLKIGAESVHVVVEGDGPVNALDGALRKALAPAYPRVSQMNLADYKVRILDSHTGTAAKTRVFIESADGTTRWGTIGVSFNIIDASWQALVDSVDYFLNRGGVAPVPRL